MRIPTPLNTGPEPLWLAALPPKCRHHLLDHGGTIANRIRRSTHDEQAITHRSRTIHYLSWCNTIGLDDPCTPTIPIQGQNWIVACYAVALIRGDTLTGVRIRPTTLMGYIRQALALHIDRSLPTPRLADVDYIKIMSNAVKKYESVPKRQDMISDGMFHFIARLTKHSSQDSFVRAVTDWIILGAYKGFRKSE